MAEHVQSSSNIFLRNLQELARAIIRPSSYVPGLAVAVVAGAYNVFIDISYAALIFSGVLAPYLASGIGLMLFSGIIYFALLALTTSLEGVFAAAQDGVLFAVLAAAISTQMRDTATPEIIFYTVVAAILVTTIIEGVIYILMGRFGLGRMVRYVPYSVIGGFLAGIGWVLATGSVSVTTGRDVLMSNLAELFQMPLILHWLPGVIFGIVMLVATRVWKSPWILPGMLLGGIALFYIAIFASGIGFAEAQAQGWLLGPFEGGAIWRPLIIPAFTNADWLVILQEAGNIASILFVGIVTMLLSVSAIELDMRQDLDLNHELQTLGVLNLLSAFTGGLTGYHDVQTTALAHQLKANTRLTGLMLALAYLALLVFGPSLLSFIPKLTIGGMLFYLGLQLLYEWVFESLRKLSRSDFITILLILVTVAAFGFLQGFVVGVVAAVILFAINYSRINIVKHSLTAAARRSNTDRSITQLDAIRKKGDQVTIMELQGFLFFGTADTLLDQVRQRASDETTSKLVAAIIDFRLVTGIDTSSIVIFTRMQQLAERLDFVLVLTSVSDNIYRKLSRQGLNLQTTDHFKLFDDLDHGLEWSEDKLLFDAEMTLTTTRDPLASMLKAAFPQTVDSKRVMAYLSRQNLSDGELLFRQGDAADALYFVERGTLTVYLELAEGRRLRLRTVSGGAVIGEMALYTGGRRSASVVAEVDCTVYVLRYIDLEKMEHDEPEVANAFHRFVAHLLADRVADSNRLIEALMR